MQNSRCLKNRTQHLVVLVMFFVFNMWGNRTTARVKAAAADHDEGRPKRSTARHSSLRSRQTCKTSAAGLNWTLTTKCFHVLTEPARWTVKFTEESLTHTHTHSYKSMVYTEFPQCNAHRKQWSCRCSCHPPPIYGKVEKTVRDLAHIAQIHLFVTNAMLLWVQQRRWRESVKQYGFQSLQRPLLSPVQHWIKLHGRLTVGGIIKVHCYPGSRFFKQ